VLVIIDNYDSFTYNIVQVLSAPPPQAPSSWRRPEIRVFRNDAITPAEIEARHPARLLISPGPCTPALAGISEEAIRHFAGRLPILGVCLGHQAIGEVFGGAVVRAGRMMHGKTSPIHHDGRGVFTDMPTGFSGMRYHSLTVDEPLPACLEASARTDQGELMGLRHRTLPIEGVQFHPESIMTEAGSVLLHNFLCSDYAELLRRPIHREKI
jgi:anthranilate synthase/aminodeoxychorismate synthase-like glutamine amidotransferase